MFERILVGFDGSNHAHRAVQMASVIAGRFQSNLTIVAVRPPVRGEGMERLDALVPLSPDGRTLEALLDDFRTRALAHGARNVESVTLHGEVLESLLAYLAQNPQDLVVVGSRGLTPGRRLFLGSVSSGLVNSARCPVLVVHPGPSLTEDPARGEEGSQPGPAAGGAP